MHITKIRGEGEDIIIDLKEIKKENTMNECRKKLDNWREMGKLLEIEIIITDSRRNGKCKQIESIIRKTPSQTKKSLGPDGFTSKNYQTFIYLFLNIIFNFRDGGREGEREGEKHQLVALCTRPRGQNQRFKHVPWRGIKLATFQLAGQCPTNWAITARALPNI